MHRQLALGIVLVFLSGTVCWGWGNSLLDQRDLVLQEKHSQEQMLATMVANTQNSEKLLDTNRPGQLMAHTQLLARARERHILPILILDEISQSVEPLGIWLIALSIEEEDVVIEGNALSHSDVGQFLHNLEESTMFGRLVRIETYPQALHGTDSVQKFSLQFTAQMSK